MSATRRIAWIIGEVTGIGFAAAAAVCLVHPGNVGSNGRFHLTTARAAVQTPMLARTAAGVSL